ncbi:MAG: group 1 truncated hemoglobin [Pseudomonadota bacterium]
MKLTLMIAATVFAASAAAQAPADDTVYRGLGGQAGIGKLVASFIPLIQADPRIKDFFTDVDIAHLSAKLAEQICVLAGGPCVYKGKDMTTIHDGLNITNAHFNALAEDLQIAMEKNGIASAVQNKLVAKLAPMQREIVTK